MASEHVASIALFLSLVAAVPSQSALHPARAVSGLAEDDLTGSGLEIVQEAGSFGAKRSETPEARIARQWRDLAERVRRQAKLLDDRERSALLDLADQYEARADRLNGSKEPS